MFGLISAGLNLATGIAKGIVAKNAREQYIESLKKANMTMPESIKVADLMMGDMAGRGLAGYDTLQSNVESSGAEAFTQGKKVATSPAALMDLITKVDTNRSKSMMELGVQDAMTRDKNYNAYASFLSRVKAPAEQRLQQFKIDKRLAIAREKMLATKELMEGISGGLGSGLTSLGQGAELSAAKKEGDTLSQFWNNSGGGDMGGGDMGGGFTPSFPRTNNFGSNYLQEMLQNINQ